MTEKYQEALVEITSIRSNLWKQMERLDEVWNELHDVAWPRCGTICEDGNPCIVSHVGEWDANYHCSKEQLEIDHTKNHSKDRPYHLIIETGSKTIPYTWALHKTPLVPITIRFDDGNRSGEGVVAWVRPEEVWRFESILKND